jgi:hypothetical protein
LLEVGLGAYKGQIPTNYVAHLYRQTRRGLRFEANGALFSLAEPIQTAFPNVRFVFLHRDGRDVVRSGMNRPWFAPHDTLPRIGADRDGSRFEKICRLWAEMNREILKSLEGKDYLDLPFQTLVSAEGGRQLEDALDEEFDEHELAPVNESRKKDFPRYEEWPSDKRQTFWDICGPMMEEPGYGR